LSHNGVLMPLLSRVGQGTGTEPTFSFGCGDAWFNVTPADGGANGSIHSYGGGFIPTGTYAPDSGGLTFATIFGGGNPKGNWTLFIADLSRGGDQSTAAGDGFSGNVCHQAETGQVGQSALSNSGFQKTSPRFPLRAFFIPAKRSSTTDGHA
jgi:hypothetical protein